MAQITAKIDDAILDKFREIIYFKYGLRKGDFKNALEEAIREYIEKYHGVRKA
jgi:hypothetical protein